jgi:predicted nucleic acid-binding protein
MASIFWDSMLFVYLIEDHPEFARKVRRLGEHCGEHGHSIVTSALTLGELLVAPKKTGDEARAQAFRRALQPPVRLISFGAGAAERYAAIRASLTVTPADAIQLACAAEAGASVFVTNDRKLTGKRAPGIDFIIGLDGTLL